MSLAVIIASCNREDRAFSTAQSILDSGLAEVVLVDDGSSTPYQPRIRHERLSLLRLPMNSGPSVARNLGVLHTQAEWIIFLDDDDSLEPDFFHWFHDHKISSLKNFDLIHFGYHKSNQENRTVSEFTISRIENPSVLSGSWMIRRECFLNLGGYEEKLRYSENSDLIERAALAGTKTCHAGLISLTYTVGRPKRREEMAARRAQACLFYLKFRPQSDRLKMLKIGLMNSLWDKKPLLAASLIFAFLNNPRNLTK